MNICLTVFIIKRCVEENELNVEKGLPVNFRKLLFPVLLFIISYPAITRESLQLSYPYPTVWVTPLTSCTTSEKLDYNSAV